MIRKHTADLHVHSYWSDADPDQSPEAILALAELVGLSHIALTDHDFLLPLEDYLDLNQKYDIDLIPGCEFSATWKDPDTGKPVIVHVGGHWLDHSDPVLQQVLKYNQSLNYEGYVKEMLHRYNKLLSSAQQFYVDLAFEEIKQMHPQAIHRGKRDVVRFLVENAYAPNARIAYDHLAFGGEAHVSPTDFLPFAPLEDVVAAITRRSLATLNHLFYSKMSMDGNRALLASFKEQGGQCLETIYSPYGAVDQAYLFVICREFNLLPNLGSDRHHKKQPLLIGSKEAFLALQRRQLDEYGSLYIEPWRMMRANKQSNPENSSIYSTTSGLLH